jgi:hypothetical protein
MILPIHIVAALAGLACATYLFFRPSQTVLKTSYGLLAGTLASGTVLAISTGSHLLEACMMGLLYTGAVSLGILAARRKLAAQKVRIKHD